MAGGGGESQISLLYTPTWIVTVVCALIVTISLAFERLLHRLGKYLLKNKKRKPLFDALQKVKEELMLLGFISFLLVVFEDPLQRVCIPDSATRHLRPCKKNDAATATSGGARRLLAGGEASTHCQKLGKVPLLSVSAIHQLHIFIFALAITHAFLSLLTVLLGFLKMRKWRSWERSLQDGDANATPQIKLVEEFTFIKENYKGFGKASFILSWVNSFFKHILQPVTETDYRTIRHGFIMKHCSGNRQLDFHSYMTRVLEADFKKVVGIRCYLWIFLMIFLFFNMYVEDLNILSWISFVPVILTLAVGTKLEHVISLLAHDVAEKHTVIQGSELVVEPSDKFFWFSRPRKMLYLIHFILFQSAFEIAFFIWIVATYGARSCIMGNIRYAWLRVVCSVIAQLICSYITLPLYAIVTQMGSSFSKEIFDEYVQTGLLDWAKGAKNKKKNRKSVSNWIKLNKGETAGSIQSQTVVVQGEPADEGRITDISEADVLV